MSQFEVFRRKPWRKVGNRYEPNARARCYHVAFAASEEEARNICQEGPANQAMDEGKKYRHLAFFEYRRA